MIVKVLCSVVIATGMLGVFVFLLSLPNPDPREIAWLFASLIWLGGGIFVLVSTMKKEKE